MPRVMLDSDICVDVMRGRSPSIRIRLERTNREDVAVSSIVAAELWTGVSKSAQPERSKEAVLAFLAYVTVLDWPAEAAPRYGEIRARLETSGRSIGAMDLLIAAHALYEKATLVTRNLSEFRRVADLKVESW
ncbi:MAG: type II toxin-antitoxin system VapC family toxin [Candidatus Binatus sp.]